MYEQFVKKKPNYVEVSVKKTIIQCLFYSFRQLLACLNVLPQIMHDGYWQLVHIQFI